MPKTTKSEIEKKLPPTSKVMGWTVVIICVAFLIWCCYEMHRQNDLSPLAYIGGEIGAILTASFGLYCWRAKATDTFKIALLKAELEKQEDITINTNIPQDSGIENYMGDESNGNYVE